MIQSDDNLAQNIHKVHVVEEGARSGYVYKSFQPSISKQHCCQTHVFVLVLFYGRKPHFLVCLKDSGFINNSDDHATYSRCNSKERI